MPTTTPTPTPSKELNSHITRMKAITQDEYGFAHVLHLQEVQKPEVGNDDVVLRVHAAGVHIGDWHMMTGEPRLRVF
jgi:NADPH:quinone reductase-like Zn-dependent oxidoreductase